MGGGRLGPGPLRVGFLVNPVAGMGGRLGLKGTDGPALAEALRRGARPVAPGRARAFLEALRSLAGPLGVRLGFHAPPGVMGGSLLGEAGIPWRSVPCVDPGKWPTSRGDTLRCAGELARLGVDVIVFVGGDGTARDVLDATRGGVPVLGVPSGVKMYSAVFAVNPAAAARILADCALRGCRVEPREVLDIDEEAFRRDELRVRLYGYAPTPVEEGLVQSGKEAAPAGEEAAGLGEYVAESMEECRLYLLGPGSTVKAVADALGVEKTLLGVDAVHNGRLVGRDLDEAGILRLLDSHERAAIVVTPIGGQGFIFGRGNQQFSPQVIRRVGAGNIIIVATPTKLRRLNVLRVDTGDEELDRLLSGWRRVITGYARYRLVKVVPGY
ncbi:ATP-NAD kinase family protein [Stetteria hydrogenophila]